MDNQYEEKPTTKTPIDKKRLFLFILILSVPLTSLLSFFIVQRSAQHVFTLTETIQKVDSPTVAIVFGGGIGVNGPLPLLQDRLDTAKDLYDEGVVDKIILSGDNRFLNYNEPQAMQDYLAGKGMPQDSMQQDLAGRSTYETCERASKVFSLERVLLVSELTHLPRAVFLCQQFGLEAYGVISEGEASNGAQVGQKWREVLARNKAVFNVYFIGESTVLGEKIEL